jgi:hypothetical protein
MFTLFLKKLLIIVINDLIVKKYRCAYFDNYRLSKSIILSTKKEFTNNPLQFYVEVVIVNPFYNSIII